MVVPVILIHSGKQDYVDLCIRQALDYGNKVILIGDNDYGKGEFYPISSYESMAIEFDRIYKHMSTNTYFFETKAWRRWFVLAEFMRSHSIDRAFSCDTDVLIYCDITKEVNKLGTYKAAYIMPPNDDNRYEWFHSAHASIWTLEAINDFCFFSCDLYSKDKMKLLEEKWKYHLEHEIPGGIDDMTALYLFTKEYEHEILNLAHVTGNSVFDNNINDSENEFLNEYEIKNNIKKLMWQGRYPYCYNTLLNQRVRFNSIHFQGHAKSLMPSYYRGKGFKLKTLQWGLKKIKQKIINSF